MLTDIHVVQKINPGNIQNIILAISSRQYGQNLLMTVKRSGSSKIAAENNYNPANFENSV